MTQGNMARSGSIQPQRPRKPSIEAKVTDRKPLQVMHISRKNDKDEAEEDSLSSKEISGNPQEKTQTDARKTSNTSPTRNQSDNKFSKQQDFSTDSFDGVTMEDLLGPPEQSTKQIQTSQSQSSPFSTAESFPGAISRSVDDFDFDEDAFLAALDENEPIGNTGEIAKGAVIGVESDGVYVDIGGKAPGFMPKNECGLGVITSLKERFPKGLEVEVLVTREQNADGMVTISCRALALRKSWDKVCQLQKEGKVVKVIINGFNRGGVTCDLEGLRGFIPRSQLDNGENHESYVGKTLGVAFLEANPETRKLVLSEKRAAIVSRFSELEIGQLIEGEIVAIKPYGFFIELGGISGLLHHSMITNGSFRSLREVFRQGDKVKAMITELDPSRGRISLNTALLEGPPGELLTDKEKVMSEASERAEKARKTLDNKEEETKTSSEEKI